MEEKRTGFKSIDEYVSKFSPEIQETLQRLRRVIKEAAPEAEEKISYQMPAFALHGNLVYFAVGKNHIGFYPTPSGIEAFKTELAEYKVTKGSIRFPLKKPLPYELISRIVRYRADENKQKQKRPKQPLTSKGERGLGR
ncbi:MAG: hypothetical protein HPY50_09640 [Firmicutes bacterium]|nr:hypothetical protein [Bacillota bacterium]